MLTIDRRRGRDGGRMMVDVGRTLWQGVRQLGDDETAMLVGFERQ